MRILRKFLIWFFAILLIANILLVVTGNTHMYRGIKNTYLVGRTGPEIDDMNAFPFEVVEADSPQAWPKAATYGTVGMNDTQKQKLDSIKTVAFTVIKDGELLYEHYDRGWDADSSFNTFSVTKSLVSALVGIAMDKNLIESVFDPVSKYLPEYGEGAKADLRLVHLLTMSTGLDYKEEPDPFGTNAIAYYGSDLRQTMDDCEVVEPVGQQFDYVSGSTSIVAWVLEAVVKKPLDEIAQEWLWQPLGAEQPAYWGKDREDGTIRSFCCFNATARDMARLGQLYLDSGRWNGRQIVPQEFVEQSLIPADLKDKKLGGTQNERYGYFWWLHPDKDTGPFFFARGYKGQYIIVVPSERLVIVRGGYTDYGKDKRGYHQDMFLYLDIARDLVKQAS